MINFSQLGIDLGQRQTDPRDIFMGLPSKSERFEYPRDVQGEVWKQWYLNRNNKDTIIKMNTGSGKTIVALMILQSCLNEDKGPALYVVPDSFLVNQVVTQAMTIGVKVVTSENDLDYKRGKAILVVNIQKLVNGKSVFGCREENNISIGSVVVDDMHACIGSIQEQYTISIPRSEKSIYASLISLVEDSLKLQSEGTFSDIVEERSNDNMLVPFWTWQNVSGQVYAILSENQENDYIKFKFNLVKDYLKFTHCYVSQKEISIIPFCNAINKIKSFDDAQRRIYMSATLPDDSPFTTVLGVKFSGGAKVITPEKANDIGERMIIVPKIVNKNVLDFEMREAIAKKANEYNVVVLVPSTAMAKEWEKLGAIVLKKETIDDGIKEIKSKNAGLHAIVNRYDGIDLPDDACRILVIDGLPNIRNQNDKYEQETMRKSTRIQKELITKIEQGMGRGVRSTNDYCLVFLLGNQLTDVLYTDHCIEYFSNATRTQFELSEKMCEQIQDKSIEELMDFCDLILKRDPQWISICKSVINNIEYNKDINISQEAMVLRNAFDCGMSGDISKAIAEINTLVNSEENQRKKGYYKQILAEYTNMVNADDAQQILKSAKKCNIDLLNPIGGIVYNRELVNQTEQSEGIKLYFEKNSFTENSYRIKVDSVLDDLVFTDNSSKRFENAVAEIFKILGMNAYQPEREYGKGPDDFVILGGKEYLVIECKNEATTDTICKKYCNQLIGSVSWFKNQYNDPTLSCTPIMIHPCNVFEYECSPIPSIRIMTKKSMDEFKKCIHDFSIALCSDGKWRDLQEIGKLLTAYRLNGTDIVSRYTETFQVKNAK